MIEVFTFDAYDLLDPGASLSFVTPYIIKKFHILSKRLLDPFSVTTPIGDSILEDKFYRDCTISCQTQKYHG